MPSNDKAMPRIDPDVLDEACWWVQRWISGSMHDPDWDESWLESVRSLGEAFAIVQSEVGNGKSSGQPLWRYMTVPTRVADEILSTMTLRPHKHAFQSFTTSARLAAEIGADLGRGGEVPLLVCADVPDGDVMFGMADLKASKNPAVRDALRCLDDWHHQDEVVVRVDRPLRLTVARPVDWDTDLEDAPPSPR